MRARMRRVAPRIPRRAPVRLAPTLRAPVLRTLALRLVVRIPRAMRRLPVRAVLRAPVFLIELLPVRFVGMNYPPPRK